MEDIRKMFSKIEDGFPEIVLRSKVKELTGGLVCSQTLANAEQKGTGPKNKVIIRRKVGYPKQDFVEWFRHYTKTDQTKKVITTEK